uniref:DUF7920 domain-containing protein n=1 Tax=Trachysalambria curvirostris majanivirus TaxID=2984281 RepID=A0A9C7BNA0_9VIRU|nr:MAG: hypothetical protein [Trachysalambria curvirostris majanivirus]
MEGPLSFNETFKGIQQLFQQQHNKRLPVSLETAIYLNYTNEARNSEKDVEKLISEITHFKKAKLVSVTTSAVPEGILSPGYNATLKDVRIKSRGSDDIIYTNNPKIRRLIPRGLTLININGEDDTVIYANKKFTGGVGDEDHSQPQNDKIWRQYCIKNPDTAEYIISTEKQNGEAAHFSGRYIDGKFYIITGSKNVHMLIKEKSEINLYDGQRYDIAKVVAETVCDVLDGLQPRVYQLICSLLHHTKCTVVCEILQPNNQHIVDLSYLEKTKLMVIALTSTFMDKNESSLTALPPHHALDMMSCLGFSCVPYKITAPSSMKKHKEMVRNQLYKEGEVAYFINMDKETIGIVKIKTKWYILQRALREQVVSAFDSKLRKKNWNLLNKIEKIKGRLNDLQDYVKLNDQELNHWKILYGEFFIWLNGEVGSSRIEVNTIRPKFPTIWKSFIKTNQQKLPLVPRLELRGIKPAIILIIRRFENNTKSLVKSLSL